MNVYVLYAGDDWLSRDSLRLENICADKQAVYDMIRRGLRGDWFTWRGLEKAEAIVAINDDILRNQAEFEYLGNGLVEERSVVFHRRDT